MSSHLIRAALGWPNIQASAYYRIPKLALTIAHLAGRE